MLAASMLEAWRRRMEIGNMTDRIECHLEESFHREKVRTGAPIAKFCFLAGS
jgi:hypothetical protein